MDLTITIDDAVAKVIESEAAAQGLTLEDMVAQELRPLIERHRAAPSKEEIELKQQIADAQRQLHALAAPTVLTIDNYIQNNSLVLSKGTGVLPTPLIGPGAA